MYIAADIQIPMWTAITVLLPIVIIVVGLAVVDRVQRFGYWKSESQLKDDRAKADLYAGVQSIVAILPTIKQLPDDIAKVNKALSETCVTMKQFVAEKFTELHTERMRTTQYLQTQFNEIEHAHEHMEAHHDEIATSVRSHDESVHYLERLHPDGDGVRPAPHFCRVVDFSESLGRLPVMLQMMETMVRMERPREELLRNYENQMQGLTALMRAMADKIQGGISPSERR